MIEPDSSYLIDFYTRNATLGSSERTRLLDLYESFWRCLEYDSRGRDFWGRKLADGPSFATTAFMAQYEAETEAAFTSVPLSERRPPGPSRLGRTVIQRFTDALFSLDRLPTVRVLGDPLSDEYLEGIIKAGLMWSAWAEARSLGGALGSVFVTFAFHDGKPVFEVHNSKHCIPRWKDRATGELESVDITYQYPKQVKTRKGWATHFFWFRRCIDTRTDTVYEPVPVDYDLGRADTWRVKTQVEHGFGFVPGEWVKNTRDSSSIDGEPDCYGQFDAIAEYDALMGLATMGTLPNADPTTVVKTRKKVSEVRKGSANAIILDPGDDAGYMTLGAESAQACLSVAAAKKADIVQALSVIIEGNDGAQVAATATEIRHRYRAFHGRVDTFRVQYGDAIKRFCEKLLRAAATLTRPRLPKGYEQDVDTTTLGAEQRAGLIGPAGGLPTEFVDGPEEDLPSLVRDTIDLPPKVVDADGDEGTPPELRPRELGPGGVVEVTWPEHTTPSPSEVTAIVQGLTAAREAGFLDSQTAAALFAQFMGLSDPAAIFRRAKKEADEKAASQARAMEAQIAAATALGGFGGPQLGPSDNERQQDNDDADSETEDGE